MILIVGLGNPGKQYHHTRHNIGFECLDAFARSNQLSWSSLSSSKSLLIKTEQFTLLKPQTFMNQSGYSVRKIKDLYKISTQNIWVLHDELDLALGTYKIHKQKSSAGHNGVQSITDHLATNHYYRWRIGIGRPTNHMPISEYVLQAFSTSEISQITAVIPKITESLNYALTHGVDKAVSRYNQSNTPLTT